MPKMKLTIAAIRDLPLAEAGQILYYDTDLPGFGVRVGREKRVFFAESRVNGKTRRVNIGGSTALNADQARKAAKVELGKMASGIDPSTEKAEKRAKEAAGRAETVTLGTAFKDYVASRDLKPRTRAEYERINEAYFAEWQSSELAQITPASVSERFAKLTKAHGKAAANGAMRVLRAVYNMARVTTAQHDGTKTLPENPVNRLSDLRTWNKIGRRSTYVTASDMPAFFEAIRSEDRGQDFSDLMEILVRTGLRISELTSLSWATVNMGEQSFVVMDTKNGTDHALPMATQVHAIFERRYATTGGVGFVFPGDGKAGHIGIARKPLLAARKASGLTWSNHDLRRSFVTVAERLDLSSFTLKRLINHAIEKDRGATGGYIGYDLDRLRLATQRISDEIDRMAKLTPAPVQADQAEDVGATFEPEFREAAVAA